jgi:hypothetical protein
MLKFALGLGGVLAVMGTLCRSPSESREYCGVCAAML